MLLSISFSFPTPSLGAGEVHRSLWGTLTTLDDMTWAGFQPLLCGVTCLSHLVFLGFLDAKMGTVVRMVRSLPFAVRVRWLLDIVEVCYCEGLCTCPTLPPDAGAAGSGRGV